MNLSRLSADHLRQIFTDLGIKQQYHYIYDTDFLTLDPTDITITLSVAEESYLDQLNLPVPEPGVLAAYPDCNRHSKWATCRADEATIKSGGDAPPAFGEFEFTIDKYFTDKNPEVKGGGHVLDWAAHYLNGIYVVRFYEPQRFIGQKCLQQVNLNQQEIESCTGATAR